MLKIFAAAVLIAGFAGAQTTACKVLTPDAQDAMIASPANHTVLFEDADVRVLDVHSAPHTQETPHTHRLPGVMYFLQQGAGTMNTPENPAGVSHPADPNFKPYVKFVAPQGLHWTENTGEMPFHAIRVEFKHPGCALDGSRPAQLPMKDEMTIMKAAHTVLVENDEVRIVDIELAPHAREELYNEPWAGVMYVQQGGTIGFALRRETLASGQVASVGPVVDFRLENLGSGPIHLIWFEIKHGTWMGL